MLSTVAAPAAPTSRPIPDAMPASPPAIAATDGSTVADAATWKNPAAAAALQTSVDMLQQIEDGIVKHYNEVDKVTAYATDLAQSNDMFASASDAVATDASKDNDQFVPLIGKASGGVQAAQARLSSKDIASEWPGERADVLRAVRTAKAIATNVGRQLDPLSQPTPAAT